MRIPSEGGSIELKGHIFSITKSNLSRIKCVTMTDSLVPFGTKDTFTVYGNKYRIGKMKYQNKKLTIIAVRV